MEIILIPSTLCNLRCSYCYELSVLGDKRRMTLETLQLVYERLASHFAAHGVEQARFIWHGGEPLLLPPDFYWQAFELQEKVFSGVATRRSNTTQTNLTVLDSARTELLRDGFDAAGVSLDLFGSLRVNAAGEGMEGKALANLEKLLTEGVALGGITVLTRANRLRVARIYEFYRQRNMGFRLLPLHAGDFAQGQWFEISQADTLRALITLADLWIADPGAAFVHPVVTTIRDVFLHHTTGATLEPYDKRRRERQIAIDRDGYAGCYEHAGQREHAFGSLRERSLDELLASDARRRIAETSWARVEQACSSCPHFQKSCSAFPVGEGGNEYWDRTERGVHCSAYSGLIAHIELRFRELGLIGGASAAERGRFAAPLDSTWQVLA
jgi:uncharacterized protein